MWYIMSSNQPYRCWHHSQFINRWIYKVGLPLYKQPSKGITSILATQYPKDIPWVDGQIKKLGHHFCPLPWMVCNVPWAPTIDIDIDTPFNSSMDAWVRLVHYCTSKQTRGPHPYWSYIPKDIPWVDGWKLGHFHPLPCMVCGVPWAPTINADFGTTLNPSKGTWMMLIHHCISNQARGSHPYWPHNTKRIYHGWMDENWGTSCSCLGWCVMYHELQPSIHVLTPLSIHL